jgi:hypothetical protein
MGSSSNVAALHNMPCVRLDFSGSRPSPRKSDLASDLPRRELRRVDVDIRVAVEHLFESLEKGDTSRDLSALERLLEVPTESVRQLEVWRETVSVLEVAREVSERTEGSIEPG